MIKTLQFLEPKQAAGLLARAALSLGYSGLPAQSFKGEEEIRANVVEEVRSELGIDSNDNSVEAIERIAEFLDEESDRLLSPPDTQAALKRMAARGDLPSDLYEIHIIGNVSDLYGRHFALEKDIIETTIKRPDAEQHFGPDQGYAQPKLISIFQKLFRTKWPLKDFIVIVAAQRDGFILNVHQSWRIYPTRVNIAGAEQPLDLLKRFADHYGANLEVEGKRGNFFLSAGVGPSEIRWDATIRRTVVISRFSQLDLSTDQEQSVLIVGIDSTRYSSTLKDMRVRREDMLDTLVNEPTKPTA